MVFSNQPRLVQVIQQAAYVLVHGGHRRQVVLHVALIDVAYAVVSAEASLHQRPVKRLERIPIGLPLYRRQPRNHQPPAGCPRGVFRANGQFRLPWQQFQIAVGEVTRQGHLLLRRPRRTPLVGIE